MEITSIFKHALMISFFVFVMMLFVDFIDMASRGRMSDIIKGGRWRQYTLTSFLGSTPGCLGAFMNVSLYVHGMISFGAIVGGMIATSGDEAFVMLTQFPGTALALFALLFVFGIFFAWISDKIIPYLGFIPCESCIGAHCEECLTDINNQESMSNIFRPANLIENFQFLHFTRFLLLMLIVSFLVLISTGTLGPSTWDWKRITFISLSLCTLCIIMVCSEHYLESHIWDHIIKNTCFVYSYGVLGHFFLYTGAWLSGILMPLSITYAVDISDLSLIGYYPGIRTASHIRDDVCKGTYTLFSTLHNIICTRWSRHAPISFI